jgi:hypothetical protein
MPTIICMQFNILYLSQHLEVLTTLLFHTVHSIFIHVRSLHKLQYGSVYPNSSPLNLDCEVAI